MNDDRFRMWFRTDGGWTLCVVHKRGRKHVHVFFPGALEFETIPIAEFDRKSKAPIAPVRPKKVARNIKNKLKVLDRQPTLAMKELLSALLH